MRGVDYRSGGDTRGIALLIMSQFDNERTYKQGLGRVGRYDEQYMRCLWNEAGDPVDTDKRSAYLSRLREASKPAGGKLENKRRSKLLDKQDSKT